MREFLIVGAVLLYSLPAHAALKPADILVSDNESNHIVRVDPDTGLQIEFADRGDVELCSVFPTPLSPFSPQGLAIDSSGRVYSVNVANLPFPAPSEVIRFNVDGSCDSVASGLDLAESDDVTIERAGTLLITTISCPSCGATSPPALVRVDPDTGIQDAFSSGGFLADPELIAVDPIDGSIFVADDGDLSAQMPPTILRIDPVSGEQTIVSSGDLFFNLSGLAVESPSTLVVTDRGNKTVTGIASETKVIRINLALPFPQANQSRVDDPSTLPDFEGNRAEYDGIEIDRNGELIVGVQVDGPVGTFPGPNGGVIRIQPDTGAQFLVTFGGPTFSTGLGVLEGADGVAIVPEPPAALLQLVVLTVLAAVARRRMNSASTPTIRC